MSTVETFEEALAAPDKPGLILVDAALGQCLAKHADQLKDVRVGIMGYTPSHDPALTAHHFIKKPITACGIRAFALQLPEQHDAVPGRLLNIPIRILVAEDNPANQFLVSKL